MFGVCGLIELKFSVNDPYNCVIFRNTKNVKDKQTNIRTERLLTDMEKNVTDQQTNIQTDGQTDRQSDD